ncbi:hypothetical protein SARC_13716, partial [Sphaeroforma arctica JP610]
PVLCAAGDDCVGRAGVDSTGHSGSAVAAVGSVKEYHLQQLASLRYVLRRMADHDHRGYQTHSQYYNPTGGTPYGWAIGREVQGRCQRECAGDSHVAGYSADRIGIHYVLTVHEFP